MTTEKLLVILGALRLVKDITEIAIAGIVAYGIASGGPVDTRPVALALLVLISVGIESRDHLRRGAR